MTNNSSNNPIDYQRLQQAAHWFSLFADDEVSKQEQLDFERWLQSTENQQAWGFVDGVSQQFANIRQSEHHKVALDSLGSPDKARQARRNTLKLLSFLPLGVLSAWGTYKHSHLGPILQASLANYVNDYATDIGKIDHITLADNSQVSLNTASAINVNFNNILRLIELVRGEILIDTAKDPRPFEVNTNIARLRALGTRFNIRLLNDNEIQLTVLQGRVAVYRPANKPTQNWQGEEYAEHIVEAGQQVIISTDSTQIIAANSIKNISWQQGLLLADEITLVEFVEQLSRYRKGYLAVSPEIAQLRIMGSFPLNDTDKILTMLGNTLPIKINTILPWWVSLEPK